MTAKRTCGDLSIFGGSPLFDRPLHVNEPWVGDRRTFDRHLDKAWEGKKFSNDGPLAMELERRLEEKLGVEHCVLMSNGTAALAVLLSVLGVKGEVIIPSFTFVSTPHALLMAGIQPVFCDVRPGDWNISVDHCKSLITEKTSAIIPTHLWGRPSDVEALQDLADRHKIHLLFDAAHAFGCSHDGRAIGTFGDAEIFSFHATKAFHTAEGGAVTCHDAGLAAKLRQARNFGFTGYDCVSGVGTNAKMSELSAALGLTNLDGFDASVKLNKSVYRSYLEHLDGVAHASLMRFDEREANNYWYISMELSDDSPIARDDVLRILQAENILARRYFFPGCHRMEPYGTLFPQMDSQLPNTRRIAGRVLVLPGGSGVSTDDARDICHVLGFILSHPDEINERLRDPQFAGMGDVANR